jgi:hypothetical protein
MANLTSTGKRNLTTDKSQRAFSKELSIFLQVTNKSTAANIGFAARLAGRWSNGHFIAVVLHLGWTYIVGLLFVNRYFYIFNQQRFRADEQ